MFLYENSQMLVGFSKCAYLDTAKKRLLYRKVQKMLELSCYWLWYIFFFFLFQICQLTWGVSSNPAVRSGSSELRVCSERPPGVCALQLVLCGGLRCAKSPVSASPVISGKPSDKWVVNRVNSGHMYRPLFNYDAVNLWGEFKEVSAQQSNSSRLTAVFSMQLLSTGFLVFLTS